MAAFKFDFQLDEDQVEDEFSVSPGAAPKIEENNKAGPSRPRRSAPSIDVSLEELMHSLPETISYSPLHVPSLARPLLRRDLYDARFQLISQHQEMDVIPPNGVSDHVMTDKESQDGETEYVDAGTDLIPGVYEGGLKTWEGGVDLVEVLNGVQRNTGGETEGGNAGGEWVRGSRVLELGCGTAMPTAFLLHSLLSGKARRPSTDRDLQEQTIFHLQDYNLSVLQLVTLPNLFLAALPFLSSLSLENRQDPQSSSHPGEVEITQELKQAFLTLLAESQVTLNFTSGGWEDFARRFLTLAGSQDPFDLTITAETIYSGDSVGPLLDVLKGASRRTSAKQKGANGMPNGTNDREDLERQIGSLNVGETWMRSPLRESRGGVVLVAAKVLYFGVGGDLQAFLDQVKRSGGSWETVREWTQGVGRKVVKIGWDPTPGPT